MVVAIIDYNYNTLVYYKMDDVLVFFAGSADKPIGSGNKEHVADIGLYAQLATIPHWRRIFSSRWQQEPFLYNGCTYTSVDHAYQAAKFSVCGYDRASYMFCLESTSTISTKYITRKETRLEVLKPVDIALWDSSRHNIKVEIYKARYSTPIAKSALLATKNAQLWNIGPRIHPIRCTTLEAVRAMLR